MAQSNTSKINPNEVVWDKPKIDPNQVKWDSAPKINPSEVVWDEKPIMEKSFLEKVGEGVQSAFNAVRDYGTPDTPVIPKGTDRKQLYAGEAQFSVPDVVVTPPLMSRAGQERKPTVEEMDYFKKNPDVSGMATDDNAVIINPFAKLSPEARKSVILNERSRVYMPLSGNRPSFEITPKQRDTFKGYGSDQDIRETIVGRIVSDDNSAGNITKEQREFANKIVQHLDTENQLYKTPQTSITDQSPEVVQKRENMQKFLDLTDATVKGLFYQPTANIVEGGKTLTKGLQDISLASKTGSGETLARGATDVALGGASTVFSAMPPMYLANMGIGATSPLTEAMGEKVGGEAGKEIAKRITGIAGVLPFGKVMALASIASQAGEEGVKLAIEDWKIPQEDKDRILGLTGHLGFFGTLIAGNAVASKNAKKEPIKFDTQSRRERLQPKKPIPMTEADKAKIAELDKRFEEMQQTPQGEIPILPKEDVQAPYSSHLIDEKGRVIPMAEVRNATGTMPLEKPPLPELPPIDEWKPEVTPKAEISENVRTAMESAEPIKVEPKEPTIAEAKQIQPEASEPQVLFEEAGLQGVTIQKSKFGDLYLAQDPQTGSHLAFKPEELTPEGIKAHIEESRAKDWTKPPIDKPTEVIPEQVQTQPEIPKETPSGITAEKKDIPAIQPEQKKAIPEQVQPPLEQGVEVLPQNTNTSIKKPQNEGKTALPLEKTSKIGQSEYREAGKIVDGRTVNNRVPVPNMSSIDASVPNNKILTGVREVPMSDFELSGKSYSVTENKRIADIASQIKESGEITPLIVVRDAEGSYILEGGHRVDALFNLGAKSFPAKVVIDLDNPPKDYIQSKSSSPKVTEEPIQGKEKSILDGKYWSGIEEAPKNPTQQQLLDILNGRVGETNRLNWTERQQYIRDNIRLLTKDEFVKNGRQQVYANKKAAESDAKRLSDEYDSLRSQTPPVQEIRTEVKSEQRKIDELASKIKKAEQDYNYKAGNKKGAWGARTNADVKRAEELSRLKEQFKNTAGYPIEKYVESPSSLTPSKVEEAVKAAPKAGNTLKEQKKTLLDELKRANEIVSSGGGIKELKKAGFEADRITEKSEVETQSYGDRTPQMRTVKYKPAKDRIIIDVPGDGTFYTPIDGITEGIRRIEKGFPTNISEEIPKPTLKGTITATKTTNKYKDVYTKIPNSDYVSIGGSVLIKGDAPKGYEETTTPAKYGTPKQIKKVADDYFKNDNNPAEKLGYAINDKGSGFQGVSKNQMAQGKKDDVFVVFKSGDKYYTYDQSRINLLESRATNPDYKINPVNGVIQVLENGEVKAVAMPKKVNEAYNHTPDELIKEFGEGIKSIFGIEQSQPSPTKGKSGQLLGLSSIVASQGVDYLNVDDDTKKKLKAIFGIGGLIGLGVAMSGTGKSILAEVESYAKRKGIALSVAMKDFAKSEEFKKVPEADRATFEKLAGSPKLDEVNKAVEKITEKVKPVEIPKSAEPIKAVEGESPYSKRLNDAYIQSVIQATEKTTFKQKREVVPVVSTLKDKTGVFWLEGINERLKGNDLTEFVRGNLLESLKTGKEFEGATQGQKNLAIKKLQTEKVEQWIKQWQKEQKFQEIKQETETRHEELANEVLDTFLKSKLPPDQVKNLLSIAQRYRVNSDNQGKMFVGFKSRVSTLVDSYGGAGGELAGKMYEGDLQRQQLMDEGLVHINKINDIYSEIKNSFEKDRISKSVIDALENRKDAEKILDSKNKRIVYNESLKMLEKFKTELKARGYNVREDYFTHIKDVDILEQVLNDVKDIKKSDFGKLNEFISAQSRFLKPRLDADITINKDLPKVLMTYLRSVTKELAYKDGVEYYYTKFMKDVPDALQRNGSQRAINYMQNVLNPEKGRGGAWRFANFVRSNMYRNFLGMNLKASVQNMTQKDFARLRWVDGANKLTNQLWSKRESLTGALGDAVKLASRETPRFLEMTKSETPTTKSSVSELFNKIDTFQGSEGANWGVTELGSIINSAMKNPKFEELKARNGDVWAINQILAEKPNFDKAVREAAITSAETQVAAAPSMRGEIYDAPLHRLLGMFTAFKTRQLQIFKEALSKQEGINGTRAQYVLRRGMTMDVKPVEVLREVESNRVGLENMLKDAEKNNENLGVPRENVKQFIDFLKNKEGELNDAIKQIEPTSGRLKNTAFIVKYLTKVAAISAAFSVFWDMVDSTVFGDEDKEKNVVANALKRAFADILPTPFYGANPQKFFVSPVMPSGENTMRFGKFSGRGLARDLTSYGLNMIPFAGLVDRASGKRISKLIIDTAVPKKEKAGGSNINPENIYNRVYEKQEKNLYEGAYK